MTEQQDAMRQALELAREGVEIHSTNMPEYKVCAALIELAEAAEKPADEPVAAESKFDRQVEWSPCSIEHHKLVQSEPHKWPGYQTRLLYTRPQPAAQTDWEAVAADQAMTIAMLKTNLFQMQEAAKDLARQLDQKGGAA